MTILVPPLPLAEFQDVFAAAVLQNDPAVPADPRLGDLARQPGFAVYRNTVMKGCIDALQANYPAVTRLVGEEWLRAAAALFVRSHLPRRPSLIEYGAEFPGFLQRFEPATDLPYLAGVAQLDRFWTEAHVAPDDGRLSAAEVAALPNELLERAVLRPHAAARWRWFDAAPIFSIWRPNHDDDSAPLPVDLTWQGEGALLARPGGRVQAIELGRGDCAFLDACSAGRALVQAGLEALAVAPSCELPQMLQRLLLAGAFTRIDWPENTNGDLP